MNIIGTEKNINISDIEIIHKILGGELAFFELLIRRHNPFLYKIGRAYGFNHHDTEDLMQDTYVSAYLNLSKFENRASFKTWLITIMMNHCKRKMQKSGFKNEIVSEQADENIKPVFSSHANTEAMTLNKELSVIIERSLEKMPSDYRLVFSLRELNKLSVAETAEMLCITETNVKVRLNRAKKMLRRHIEEIYTPEDIFEFNLIYCDRMVEKVMTRLAQLNA